MARQHQGVVQHGAARLSSGRPHARSCPPILNLRLTCGQQTAIEQAPGTLRHAKRQVIESFERSYLEEMLTKHRRQCHACRC